MAYPTPAPLPADALDLLRKPFGESLMPPREAYVSPEVYAWEQRHLYAGSWTCVGRIADLPPQQALTVGDQSILVTGEGRAFANVCRHRGHELLPNGTACD